MGEKASTKLIKDLKTSTGVLDDLVSQFMREAHQPGYYLPLHCFYEIQPTNLCNKIFPTGLSKFARSEEFVRISLKWPIPPSADTNTTVVQLVNQESAILRGWGNTPLDCRHVMMNKFAPGTENFKRVASTIGKFVSEAEETLKQRNCD